MSTLPDTKRIHLLIKGVVQGVGFRPFVYNLAREQDVKGWVNNTSEGVELEAEGRESALEEFSQRIKSDAPPLALIEEMTLTKLPALGYKDFIIKDSEPGTTKFTLISPDIAICPDCLRELRDPLNRRYRYPFINCTNCGPRFTIITDVPYDRPSTTMSPFEMCPDCLQEYEDPANRRFHAQPNACKTCGPQVSLMGPQGNPLRTEDSVTRAAELLKSGSILAIKGLGGYHLACNALSESTVRRLRKAKNRDAKPFAVRMHSIEVVKQYCHVDPAEE
ncbi:MAG: acylphosphatase, partial [Desulfitobacterium hafniense]|nr:acylphosphatase [Desulfitobacterium hafniense]